MSSSSIHELSAARRWGMRVPYVLTGGLFSVTVWSTLIDRWGQFAPVEGVAYAFWGALSLLAVIGIRFPVRMLPLLLLQLAYKAIWIAAVGYPLLSRGELDPDGRALLQANLVGVVIDAVAIPWRFTVRAYLAGGARPLTRRIPPDPEPQSTAPAPS